MEIIPPEDLLYGYSHGFFPMADSRHGSGFAWYTAKMRGVIPLDEFHVSKNIHRLIRQNKYQVTIDAAFRDVILACAERESTWISDLIIDSYIYLHRLRFAHSVEVWENDELVGGLYGVSLGSAFFGESMFKRAKEADKVALYYCHQQLLRQKYTLWDTQFYTPHLAQFGCKEIPDEKYMTLLNKATSETRFFNPSGSDSNSELSQ